MIKLKIKLDLVIKWLLVILFAGMTINVLWQVFTRFILKDPSSYTEELARYSLIWTGILGGAYVAGQKMHLAIDILPLKLQGKNRIILEIFIQSCIFFFAFFVMVIGGIRLVSITLTLNQLSAALQIPLGFVYLIVPVSGIIILFYCTFYIYDQVILLQTSKTNTLTNGN